MQHAFRGMERAFRVMRGAFLVLLLLTNIFVNAYELSTHQALPLGGLSLDFALFLVLFNAVMIVALYVFDTFMAWARSKVARLRRDYELGEGLYNLYKHETAGQ
jgi:hypothetical protein